VNVTNLDLGPLDDDQKTTTMTWTENHLAVRSPIMTLSLAAETILTGMSPARVGIGAQKIYTQIVIGATSPMGERL